MLVAGRLVQGLPAGVGPLAFALLPETVGEPALARYIGVLIGAGGLGSVVGLLVAGPLVDHISVSSIFWLLLAVAVVLAVAVARSVPESAVRSRERIDWLGATLLAGLLAVLMLAVSQGNDWGWRSPAVLSLLAASALLAVLFVVRQQMAAHPLLDTASLRRPRSSPPTSPCS